jgi:hypothetical protein
VKAKPHRCRHGARGDWSAGGGGEVSLTSGAYGLVRALCAPSPPRPRARAFDRRASIAAPRAI